MTTPEFEALVYDIVASIPRGSVSTYGQIAFLAGFPRRARMVGHAVSHSPDSATPCHRVVNAAGRLVPGWHEQRALLEKEGVRFKKNGCVDLDECQWEAFPPGEPFNV